MARTVEPPEQRRQELIDIAKKLFLQKGYTHTTVRDILKEAGGAPGMFYYYFKSKDEIYETAMSQYIDEYVSQLCRILYEKSYTIKEKIARVLQVFTQTYLGCSEAFRQFLLRGNQDFYAQMKQKICNSLIEPVKDALDEEIENGALTGSPVKYEDAAALAPFIVYGVFGMVNYGLDGEPADKIVRSCSEKIPVYIARLLGISPDFLLNIN